ncbi:DUF397 domain-containing protein [Streptomyces triticirhizae]|uniref:DUF397 domain-containing protein n=1 Tax=Streptomyces triticirhizae TaxID=2483353 RepID=A0A3M2MDI3_9ACTN|nr:DUF397 domain-containing protein [Streptomyces triticirhizae]RMI46705.1 DUF397 domain-containing protein [Streptomyces triticirhizae]
MADQAEPQWFKSSYSGAPNSECVECATAGQNVLARDSKQPGGPRVAFSPAAWSTFAEALRARILG